MKRIVFFGILASTVSPFFYLADFKLNSSEVQQEKGSPILPPISSNWAATDGAGRALPMYATTGGFKRNKYVGIFYFLWQGQYNDEAIYDISSLTKVNPSDPKFGPPNAFHWWGEPEIGYFKADDPWVIRRNLQLLTLAGIDILFLDATNGDAYLPVVNKLCEISRAMRNQGMPTPYICFVTNTNSSQTITSIYQQFYAQNKYSDLWFRWQGKPLILGKEQEMADATIRNFFTWRYSWAWTKAKEEPHHWQWIDQTPQDYGWDKDPSIPEEIPVAVASHPFRTYIGKSFRNGREAPLNLLGITSVTQQGNYFDEQWKRALQVDPSVVFITGWNEWVAQRLINAQSESAAQAEPQIFMGKPLKSGQTYFVDLYNEEYNRDIDPMQGGYTDNYYYQLVANIRRYKGMAIPEPASAPQTILIDGRFDEWSKIKPRFIDPAGDIMHRNWPRVDRKTNYVNTTGRNDIINCSVTHDVKNLYFYAKTAQSLTSASNKNWMLLFIDSDQSAKTGWAGYDYLINKARHVDKMTISRWNGKEWTDFATGSFKYKNSEFELSIPLFAVRQNAKNVRLDFHWADNIQRLNQISEFFVNGDSAPDRRFNYRYISK